MKIPKGWRRLRKGTVLRVTDTFCPAPWAGWMFTNSAGDRIGDPGTVTTYIRKKLRK